jgi:hypothetical protein
MFTKTLIAAAVLAASISATAAPAHACMGCGIKLNGPVLNGISIQSTNLNGAKPQGIAAGGHQGVSLNGQVLAIEF